MSVTLWLHTPSVGLADSPAFGGCSDPVDLAGSYAALLGSNACPAVDPWSAPITQAIAQIEPVVYQEASWAIDQMSTTGVVSCIRLILQ
jgi:hypothetical protein